MTQSATYQSTYISDAIVGCLKRVQQLRLDLDVAINKFRLIILVGFPLFAVFSVYLAVLAGLLAEGGPQVWAFAIAAGVNTQWIGLMLTQAVSIIAIKRRRRDEFNRLTLYREQRFRRTEEAQT